MSYIEPKIRAGECQKTTKLLREYIQLVPKSILTIKRDTDDNNFIDSNTDPTFTADKNAPLSLVQRADQCASQLQSNPESKELVSEFYNTAK